MTPATANIIRDSISPQGIRLTTIHARYWRPIHSEAMTHRVFSRNARSSRAVPSGTLLREDIYIPHLMKNQAGMQSYEEMDPHDLEEAQAIWEDLAIHCQEAVRQLHNLGVHKQWANRPLEWFGFIDVLYTSVKWNNFWALRRHVAAQPEMKSLADAMWNAMDASTPELLRPGQWHLPYVSKDEEMTLDIETALKLSTARCARLSYKPFDGKDSLEAEMARFHRLVGEVPIHASPAEHQATPDIATRPRGDWCYPQQHGNLYGWRQHRKMLPYEDLGEAYA